MKIRMLLLQMIIGICVIPGISSAQVEESAEVSLEEYTDEFQENFFEALKQKGIENYDKATQLLLECKRIDPTNTVIDHELAKAYVEDKQYLLARDYAIMALDKDPANFWYLETLVDVMQRQAVTVTSIKDQLPYDRVKLKENLAQIYFNRRDYQSALEVLNELNGSPFSESLSLRIKDSLQLVNPPTIAEPDPVHAKIVPTNPMEEFSLQIQKLIEQQDYLALEDVAAEALENFPSMPLYYYAYGMALNKNGKPREAAGVLETGLDYLLEDKELAVRIYTELATSYSALGNTSKANMYLSKIKSGS